MPRMRCRVVCARGVTMESGASISAFKSVDLPTFGRPTMATLPQRVTPLVDMRKIPALAKKALPFKERVGWGWFQDSIFNTIPAFPLKGKVKSRIQPDRGPMLGQASLEQINAFTAASAAACSAARRLPPL